MLTVRNLQDYKEISTFICKVRNAMYVVIFADAHFSPVGISGLTLPLAIVAISY